MDTIFRISTKPSIKGLSSYFDAVSHHCPFSRNALNEGYSRFTYYEKPNSLSKEEIVMICLVHIEILRREYIQWVNRRERWLLNENIIFGDSNSNALKDVFIEAHWKSTLLYTKKGWVFGKFYKGSYPKERTDVVVSDNQINLFSIRPLLPKFDSRFFARIPGLQGDIHSFKEDGVSLFTAFENLPNFNSPSEVIEFVRVILKAGLSEVIKSRVKALEATGEYSFTKRYKN